MKRASNFIQSDPTVSAAVKAMQEQQERMRAADAVIAKAAPTVENRKHTKAGRFYQIDEETSLPSVTTILGCIGKPALIEWAANTERTMVLEAAANLYEDIHGTPKLSRPAFITSVLKRLTGEKAHKRELAKAGEIGTQVHAIIEWNLRKSLGQIVRDEPKISPEALIAFTSFQAWASSVELKPIEIEQVVYSRKHGYAGTLDLIAELTHEGRRRKALIDFKTGKAIYPEAFLQNAAYQVAMIEMGHGGAEIGLIVRLPKIGVDPGFEVAVVPDWDELFAVFECVKGLWLWASAEETKRREAWEASK